MKDLNKNFRVVARPKGQNYNYVIDQIGRFYNGDTEDKKYLERQRITIDFTKKEALEALRKVEERFKMGLYVQRHNYDIFLQVT